MRIFTKILKPPFSTLRENRSLLVVFADEFYLQRENYEKCEDSIYETVKLLRCLGLSIHPDKSELVPVQRIEFAWFTIKSIKMAIR